MTPLAALGLALAGAAAFGAAWMLRTMVGIVETNLAGTPLIHLDFSAREDLPPPRPELQRAGAPLVLFFHETAAEGRSYTKYLGFLEEQGYRVMAPELPPPDLSKVSQALAIFPTPFQVEAAQAALAEARVAAGEAPLVVFGVSRGAALAALALGEDASGVRALVLDGFFSSREVLEAMLARFGPIYLGRAAAWIPRWFRRWTAGLGLARVEARLGQKFPEALPALRRLRLPVLFLHGARDKTSPVEAMRRCAAEVPGAEVVLLPKARHNQGCVKAPEAYRRAVQDFLQAAGISRPAGGGGG